MWVGTKHFVVSCSFIGVVYLSLSNDRWDFPQLLSFSTLRTPVLPTCLWPCLSLCVWLSLHPPKQSLSLWGNSHTWVEVNGLVSQSDCSLKIPTPPLANRWSLKQRFQPLWILNFLSAPEGYYLAELLCGINGTFCVKYLAYNQLSKHSTVIIIIYWACSSVTDMWATETSPYLCHSLLPSSLLFTPKTSTNNSQLSFPGISSTSVPQMSASLPVFTWGAAAGLEIYKGLVKWESRRRQRKRMQLCVEWTCICFGRYVILFKSTVLMHMHCPPSPSPRVPCCQTRSQEHLWCRK